MNDSARLGTAADQGKASVVSLAQPSRPLPGLSVFLPAYNEEENIERVVAGVLAHLPAIADDYEVIVVDDGSGDRTPRIADRLAAANSRVRAVHHQTNRGYGAAVASGMAAARQPFVALLDADGQFDPADLATLARFASDNDAVIGCRAVRADPLVRRIYGCGWTLLMRLFFGLGVSDLNCGLKLFRRSTVEKIELQASGALVTAELMVKLLARGARIREVEVRHLPRLQGQQTGARPAVVLGAFRELVLLFPGLWAARWGGRRGGGGR